MALGQIVDCEVCFVERDLMWRL